MRRHGSAQVGERVFEFRAPLEFGSLDSQPTEW